MKKLKIILPIIATIVGYGAAFSQAPAVQWQHYYGGSGFDIVSSVIQTTDGGYIMAGSSNSSDGDVGPNHGNNDIWVTKIDASGVIEWQKTYGGTLDDLVFSLKQTNDGGYILAGETNSNDGDITANNGGADCWIVKLSTDGTMQWQKNFGGTWNDCARSIVQTADGGYVFLGYTSSNDMDVDGNHSTNGLADFWMVKINATGTIQWQNCFGGFGDDTGNAIMETSDGNFVAVGETWSTDGDVVGNHNSWSADAWVIKVNDSGTLVWQKSLGGSYSDRAQSVVEAIDGNYIIGASAQSNDGDVAGHHGVGTAYSDCWVLALDPSGIIQWQNSLGGFADEYTAALQKTSDGGYIMAGFTASSDGDVTDFYGGTDYWVVKLNATGILQWQLTLGDAGYEDPYDIRQTADGGYIVAGKSINTGQDKSGTTHRGGTQDDDNYWVVKLFPSALGISDSIASSPHLRIYPNPTSNFITIGNSENDAITKTEVFDLNGRLVASFDKVLDNKIEVSQLVKGTYLLKVYTENGAESLKFIKE